MADKSEPHTLAEVFETVLERKASMPEKSYVAKLLRSGTDTILCKVAEETGEVIKAAREQEKGDLTREVADLWFHCMVLLARHDLTLADIEEELARR